MRERNGKMYIHLQCEKRVDSLYCPMPVWTISKWMGDLRPMVVGEEEVSGVMLPRACRGEGHGDAGHGGVGQGHGGAGVCVRVEVLGCEALR